MLSCLYRLSNRGVAEDRPVLSNESFICPHHKFVYKPQCMELPRLSDMFVVLWDDEYPKLTSVYGPPKGGDISITVTETGYAVAQEGNYVLYNY